MEGVPFVTARATAGSRSRWQRWLVLLVATAAVAAVFAYSNEDVGIAIGPSCTIGVTGTAATLTIRGWQSSPACDSFDAGSSVALYRFRGNVGTPTICQYQMDRLLFTVNDEGSLKLVGNLLCTALRSRPQPKRQLA